MVIKLTKIDAEMLAEHLAGGVLELNPDNQDDMDKIVWLQGIIEKLGYCPDDFTSM